MLSLEIFYIWPFEKINFICILLSRSQLQNRLFVKLKKMIIPIFARKGYQDIKITIPNYQKLCYPCLVCFRIRFDKQTSIKADIKVKIILNFKIDFFQKAKCKRFQDIAFVKLENVSFQTLPTTDPGNFSLDFSSF